MPMAARARRQLTRNPRHAIKVFQICLQCCQHIRRSGNTVGVFRFLIPLATDSLSLFVQTSNSPILRLPLPDGSFVGSVIVANLFGLLLPLGRTRQVVMLVAVRFVAFVPVRYRTGYRPPAPLYFV